MCEVMKLAHEAHLKNIFAVMIRPEYVRMVKQYLASLSSKVRVGTVIGFHEGTATIEAKLSEAEKALADGADELDFVVNYQEFLKGDKELVRQEVIRGTGLVLGRQRISKWIIEIAALTDLQIAELTKLISDTVSENFSGKESQVFVKSSTGFFHTEGGKPNGATVQGIKIMMENAGKLPVKAAGGVRNFEDARQMVDLGVKRIGTSSAASLIGGSNIAGGY